MSGSLNKVILIGNVGRDPEIRSTSSGQKIANFPLATSERWRDKQSGEQKEKTEWHRVVVFNENLIRVVEQYVRKGSSLCVEGQLATRKWTDSAGKERFTTEVSVPRFKGEIALLGGKSGGGSDDSQSSYGGGYGGGASGMGGPSDLDDEIPFSPEVR